MAFQIQCPGCGKNYDLSAQFAGKKVSCTNCGSLFHVGSEGGSLGDPSQNPYRTPTGPGGTPQQAVQSGSNPNAVASLVLGILSFVMSPVGFLCGCFSGCPCILVAGGAITTGIIGLGKSKIPGTGGKGMALTGLILGIVAILAVVGVFLLLFVFGMAGGFGDMQQEFMEGFQQGYEDGYNSWQ